MHKQDKSSNRTSRRMRYRWPKPRLDAALFKFWSLSRYGSNIFFFKFIVSVSQYMLQMIFRRKSVWKKCSIFLKKIDISIYFKLIISKYYLLLFFVKKMKTNRNRIVAWTAGVSKNIKNIYMQTILIILSKHFF